MIGSILEFKFLAVYLLDVLVGDPRWLPHPIRLIGRVIHWFDGAILKLCRNAVTKKTVGAVLALSLPWGCYILVQEMIRVAEHLNETLGIAVWIVLGYTTVAARDLWEHSIRVFQRLQHGTLAEARGAVSQLVGRDTQNLSETEIVRATVESIAENTSDGIVAPLCYLALGGPPLAMAYKAVNTLDSMIGYRNVRYQDFGWASARLDDLVNWMPARLTALSISMAAMLRLGRGRDSWRICWRDARKHPSPNSGWPEAAMAGALGIQLGGMSEYGDRIEERAKLGDPIKYLTLSLIPIALQVMGLASIILVVLLMLLMVV